MNMQDVDKVIAEILTGGNTSAVAAVPEVTGGKSSRSRSRSHSRKSRSASHHSPKHHHVGHHGGTLTIGKLKPIMIRGGEEPLQGGSVIDSLFGGEAEAAPAAPEVISGGAVGESIKGGSIKAGSKPIKGGSIKGGSIKGGSIKGGSTLPEPAPPAEAISGGESADASDLEGGKKRSHKKHRSHKKKLPEALARKKSVVMNIFEELKESKKYKKMPGNMLLKKAMEMSRGK
jgi:hypothetical protein